LDRYKSLIKNSFLFAIGSIGSKTISFFMLPLYTRYLSTSDYGQIDVFQTTITLLIPIVTLQALEAVFRFSVDMEDKDTASKIITNGIFLCIIGVFITLLLFPIFNSIEPFSSYTYLFYLIMFLTVMEGVIKQFVRGMDKINIYVSADIIYTVSFVIFNIIFLIKLKMGISGYFISIVLSHFVSICLLIIFGNIFQYISFSAFNKSFLKTMLLYSIPLIPNGLMWWIMNVSDRYMITYFLGFDATGIYSVASKFPTIITLINNMFFLAWQLSAMKEYGKKGYSHFYGNIFSVLSTFLFIIIAIILLMLKPFMKIFVTEAFFESWKYVPFLLVGAIFHAFSSFFGTNYTASKKTIGAFITTVVGAVINILINIILIPIWGIQAAAFSTMIAYFITWLFRLFHTKKLLDFKLDKRNIFISTIVISSQIFALYFIKNQSLFFAIAIILILTLFLFHQSNIRKVFYIGRQILSKLKK
jgi:O-antigen/teichoic acid export membrane protein